MTEPGLQSTESFYKALASGDPAKIQQATAPATQSIAASYDANKKNISENMPRGGSRDLAMQESDISKAGQIGGTKAQAYLGAFPALASLAGEGIGLSQNEIMAALNAFSGASSSNQAGATMAGAGKSETLGFLSSLGGAAAGGAGMALGCWIAEALWGKMDLRTIRLRIYLNDVWAKQSIVGLHVMWLYRHFGRAVARQVEKHTTVRRAFTPLFEYADRCATRWEYSKLGKLRELGLI